MSSCHAAPFPLDSEPDVGGTEGKRAMTTPGWTADRQGDVIVVRIVGSLSLADAQEIYGRLEQVLAELGHGMALFDLGQATVPSPESRHYITHWTKDHSDGRIAIATFGTSLLVRAVNRMFDSAVSLLSGRPAPTRHFSNEEAARSWLALQREQLAK